MLLTHYDLADSITIFMSSSTNTTLAILSRVLKDNNNPFK